MIPFEDATITGALTTLASSVTTQGTEAVTAILPAMAGLLAIGIVVRLGVKWIRTLGR